VNAIGELVIGLPTGFTPNGDGINDTYAPNVDGSGDLEYFAIYNRWGQMVFESYSSTIGWDGTFNGESSEMGSYVVVCTARTSLDEQRSFQGYFTLIR
jgi:gliding motility-associated-like protein